MYLLRAAAFFLLAMVVTIGHSKPLTVIPFWHSFAGHLGKTLSKICDDFNASQTHYKIVPLYKGSYPETLTSYVAAYRAGKQPPIAQIYEIATATLYQSPSVIMPIYQLMAKHQDLPYFRNEHFLPSLRRYYGDKQGRLFALPFNSSSAVLYYNKTAFKKAGIDKPPASWAQLEDAAKVILAKKIAACGFTTAYPSWVHMENFSQWHGYSFALKPNGTEGDVDAVSFKQEALKHHLKSLKRWHQLGIFKYAGRDSNSTALFTSGYCPMILQSSGAFVALKSMANFDVDVAAMPYWPQFRKAGANAVVGGAALWVSKGFSDDTYQGVAAFFNYLASPSIQAFWQKETGYFQVIDKPLPLSKPQAENLKASQIAYQQTSMPSQLSPGLRLSSYAQIRQYNDEQIEAILAGLLTVDKALERAQDYANGLLSSNHRAP